MHWTDFAIVIMFLSAGGYLLFVEPRMIRGKRTRGEIGEGESSYRLKLMRKLGVALIVCGVVGFVLLFLESRFS